MTPGGLFLLLVIGYVLFAVRVVVVLALLALLYATLIERPMRALERRHVPRRVAVLLIDVALVGGLLIPALLIAPAASGELARFREEEPAQLRATAIDWATSPHAILRGPGRRALDQAATRLATSSTDATPPAGAVVRAFKGVIAGLACLAMAYYYLVEKELLRRSVLEAVPPGARVRWSGVWDEVERAIGGWLRSRMLLAPFAGVISIIAFGALRLPYWPLLGLLAGVTEPIPILGPWLGGVPAVFLAATLSWPRALIVAVFILVRQGLVDAVLVPRLTERELGISPLTVFTAVLVAVELLGPVGALLAIPLAATVQVVAADALARRRATTGAPVSAAWRWLTGSRP